jgi:hypothetical protein
MEASIIKVKLLFAVFFLCLGAATSLFGDAMFFECSTVTFDFIGLFQFSTCPAVSGVPAGSTFTGVNLYLLPDFASADAGHFDMNQVVFHPSSTLTEWEPEIENCGLANAGGGTTVAINGCGFYSGILTAPGTFFMSAESNFDAIAAAGVTVATQLNNEFGATSGNTAGEIIEYDFTPGTVAVPEPTSRFLLVSALVFLAVLARKQRRAVRSY